VAIWARVTGTIRRRLLLGVALAVLVPVAVAWIVKAGIQPGLHDHADKVERMIDYITLGAIGFGLSTVATSLLGVLIVASMKGPRERADDYAADADDMQPTHAAPLDRVDRAQGDPGR
jgi:hypothetical protein